MDVVVTVRKEGRDRERKVIVEKKLEKGDEIGEGKADKWRKRI